ncbi:hypothetical protein BXQ17_07910 [Polaribacter sp. BM10]|uniref:hypothetical protein n=1 Tax=Polaribacter sp. BM10 TaxID=1529069 RepID=UPI00098A7DCE|nr:hypothetical protein [Polaribacter sp. BM10]AQS93990.1 hypothetical protein BXQ17_07910 [Polaribacter sp. BM10]
MNKSEKEQLLDIYFRMNNKREFTEYSVFELNELVSEAIGIVKRIDIDSDCYQNLLKAQLISKKYHEIPYSKMKQNLTDEHAIKIIQLSQYSIKEFAEKY